MAVSRVEKSKCKVCDCGRVKRNSSIRRRQIAKPRPLFPAESEAVSQRLWLRRGEMGDCLNEPVGAGHEDGEDDFLLWLAGRVVHGTVEVFVASSACVVLREQLHENADRVAKAVHGSPGVAAS